MIKTFADRDTKVLYETGTTKRLPPDIAARAARKLDFNNQWKICFRFIDGDAYDVEVTDYH